MSDSAKIGLLWLKALRLHQWVKNLLLFVPLAAAHVFTSRNSALAALEGFFCCCLLASSAYLFNDVLDAGHDRMYRKKHLRPVASGALLPKHALMMSSLRSLPGDGAKHRGTAGEGRSR